MGTLKVWFDINITNKRLMSRDIKRHETNSEKEDDDSDDGDDSEEGESEEEETRRTNEGCHVSRYR